MVYFVDLFAKYRRENLQLKNPLVIKTQCRLTMVGTKHCFCYSAWHVCTEALHIVWVDRLQHEAPVSCRIVLARSVVCESTLTHQSVLGGRHI